MAESRTVLMPLVRLPRWLDNVETRHGHVTLTVGDSALQGDCLDGVRFSARLPYDLPYDGPALLSAFIRAAEAPPNWGILLVRTGGFAVARMCGPDLVEHKIGQRHVQGRTKAGGQSQQRFARRRENQARQAYAAAAEHAVRILRPGPVVLGGDRQAVAQVLADPRLDAVVPVEPWLAGPDPKRQVLDRAITDAQAISIKMIDSDLDDTGV